VKLSEKQQEVKLCSPVSLPWYPRCI